MILRLATPADLFTIYELIDSYDGPISHDKGRVKNFARDLVYSDGVFLVEHDNCVIGCVAGIASPVMFRDEITLSVLFIYVRREWRKHTRTVIRELERMLWTTKATRLTFGITAGNETLERFFRMMGYRKLETHYEKRIGV